MYILFSSKKPAVSGLRLGCAVIIGFCSFLLLPAMTAAKDSAPPDASDHPGFSADSIVPASIRLPKKVKQLAVVNYKGNSQGIFTYYEQDKEQNWKKIFSCKAWLGQKGIGKKKEGDKKTPTGFYYLEQPFGICKNPGMDKGWHYLKVNSRHYWCAARRGKYRKYYNRLVTSKIRVPGEHLISYKTSYDYGMFISYNKQGKVGKGSAIFLHCSKNRATAGCVAIKKAYLAKLMRRLKPGCHPGIIIYHE